MKKSYTILIVILVLMAISVTIIATTNFLGVDEVKMSMSKRDSSIGFYLSTACAEEALMQIKNNPAYAPVTGGRNPQPKWINININSTTHRCSYQVINKNPPKYIKARSGIGTDIFPRNLEIKITQVNPKIIIDYWLEK